MADYHEPEAEKAGGKEAKLAEIQKKIDELIAEREELKASAVQQEK